MNNNVTTTVIDIQGVLERLPHRYPFLLIDRLLEVGEDAAGVKFVRALKNVTDRKSVV